MHLTSILNSLAIGFYLGIILLSAVVTAAGPFILCYLTISRLLQFLAKRRLRVPRNTSVHPSVGSAVARNAASSQAPRDTCAPDGLGTVDNT